MKLSEFRKQPRGPRLFDCFHHPIPIPSPLGDFVVELVVDMDAVPTEKMLDMLCELVTDFIRDRELLVQLIYSDYNKACVDPGLGPEWMQACNVPLGLPIEGIRAYLDPRTLGVSDFGDGVCAAVYVGPDWDREHGLCFSYTEAGWTEVDG